ncbi:MAG: hypothetical protein A6F72_03465 [Cycloclasticus sp. symbiont of Poecilosclerida sp. N]|nr:MAG: hypothetical protein A6F72_03465 [Cycloclasticus sp. symbiont of Poecilosclerida sp. N]
MSFNKSLGDNLKKLRKRRYPKDTQKDTACRVQVSRGTYQKMESGCMTVSMENYYRAAKLFDIEDSFDQLFHVDLTPFEEAES